LSDALSQMCRLLLDAIGTYVVRGADSEVEEFRRRLTRLTRQMEGPQTPMTVLTVTSDAVEAMETYCERTTEHNRAERQERQDMLAMLTDTIANLAGQTDGSVAKLQAIEKQLERAQELDDIRALKQHLGESLQSLREAVAQHRSNSVATIEQLRNQVALARQRIPAEPMELAREPAEMDFLPEAPIDAGESGAAAYVAVVRLRRADQIADRFGDVVRHRMLGMIGTQLKTMLGPGDRLLRWRGTAFVMFLNSRESLVQIRARLAETVSIIGQEHIEVGAKTSLLSVSADWTVFQQADYPTLEAVFNEVDSFLGGFAHAQAPAAALAGSGMKKGPRP
jgi:GGDEF domain-containing protein